MEMGKNKKNSLWGRALGVNYWKPFDSMPEYPGPHRIFREFIPCFTPKLNSFFLCYVNNELLKTGSHISIFGDIQNCKNQEYQCQAKPFTAAFGKKYKDEKRAEDYSNEGRP